jgi:hypothetical protein
LPAKWIPAFAGMTGGEPTPINRLFSLCLCASVVNLSIAKTA